MFLEKMSDFFDTRAKTYDSHMFMNLSLDEFYEEIAKCVSCNNPKLRLLDIGCGTGIELSNLFKKYPNMSVTGIDISQQMLNMLKEKYEEKEISLICGSYFDVPFGENYDIILSTYSLHHWNEKEKIIIYEKIHTSLKEGGKFISGDYTCKTKEREQFLQSEFIRLRKKENLLDGEFYHFDIPLTVETDVKLLQDTGFVDIKVVKEWEDASIIISKK